MWLKLSSRGVQHCQVWADGSSGPNTPCEIELVFCCSQVQIKAAKQRMVMASLYLGTGLLEQELVSMEGFGNAKKGMQGRDVEGNHASG